MTRQQVSLEHGEGGELSHKLLGEVFVSRFGHAEESKWDAARLAVPEGRIALTTDTFTLQPLFVNGCNIGKLAVAGTVNDLTVSGAVPRYLTAGFVIEEGFPVRDLMTIVDAMAAEAQKSGVRIVAGDTKIIKRGTIGGVIINTAGVGVIPPEFDLHPEAMQEGDAVIVSGPIGDHAVAVLAARGELGVMTDLPSDCTSLYSMIREVRERGAEVRFMRDPTRGGLATTLVEIAEDFGAVIEIEQEVIPIRPEVEGVCELLGYDPLYFASEGRAVLIVAESDAPRVLHVLRETEEGKEAAVIGRVVGRGEGKVLLKSALGSRRRVLRLQGMQLPRIC